jgi:hypothetical protein
MYALRTITHYEPSLHVGQCRKPLPLDAYIYKGKGKGHPITGHEGPEGEQTYSSTLSLTSVLVGDGWSTPRPGRFIPGKDPVPIV